MDKLIEIEEDDDHEIASMINIKESS